jgi:hypothetical protein
MAGTLLVMKATIDIPDDLYREVKAKSAMEGRPIQDVAIELFGEWVRKSPRRQSDEPSVGELMVDLCGAIDSGVTDLSTNPAYLEGLGRGSARDR